MSANLRGIAGHGAFVAGFLSLWEYGARSEFLPQTFFGSPAGIAKYLWGGFAVSGKLWLDLGYTVSGTLISFVLGSLLAMGLGLTFVVLPKLERAMDPYLMVFNAMPRIALAPLFLLWFGLGLGSKVAVGTSLAFFIVLA